MDLFQALSHELKQAPARGTLALTANQRSARSLRYDHDLHQKASGAKFWEPATILAWQSWLPLLWRELVLAGEAHEILLNATQEDSIWRTIIAAEKEIRSTQPLEGLADTASHAWRLLHSYCAESRANSYLGNYDNRVFLRWAAEFQGRCKRAGYITDAELPGKLREAFACGKLAAPGTILLVGFDRFTPAQKNLLETIQSCGGEIRELRTAADPVERHIVDSPSEREEVAACARWIGAYRGLNPNARVGVIVPSIESCRTIIDRTFREVLAPELNDIEAPVGAAPFEFSLGVPLASTAMVGAALDLLRWAAGPLPLNRVSSLLLSPYFAMEEPRGVELLARAELDAFAVRQQPLLEPQLSMDQLWRVLSTAGTAGIPQLEARLRAIRQKTWKEKFTSPRRSHADWAAVIRDYLRTAGWASSAQLDSIEFQTRNKWEDALDELTTLDLDDWRTSFEDALQSLERIVGKALFAPETHHAPVQILGPLEAAGSRFDAVWVLRANDFEWPTSSSVDPFLPWGLQRDFGMPGADPALDLELGRQITERIADSVPRIIFSYARESTDRHQHPSTILAGMELKRSAADEIAPPGVPAQPISMEMVEEEPRIPPPPSGAVHGGAAVLELQAACGFRAFSEKRLFASALDSNGLGLDAGMRGSIVHSVLDRFWARTVSQAALRRMSPTERQTALEQAIDESMAEINRQALEGWSLEYVSVERQRLLNLLLPWLDYEARRTTPFTVRSREKKLPNVRIDPLVLEIRVDRVDEIPPLDGDQPRTVILDYKTGEAKPSEWLGERPDAPQLPLYAVAADDPHLAAIAFANIRAGKGMGLNGYEQEKGILPTHNKLPTESLAAQIAEWSGVLASLARDFHSGLVTVNPKNYPTTCRFCQQRLFCRLDVTGLETNASAEDADDTEEEEELG